MNDEILKAQERLITSAFDQAKTYSQVILGIGYVGLFATWGFTKEFLSKNEVLLSALFATIPLSIFIFFEVFSMFFSSWNLIALTKAVQNPSTFQKNMEEYQSKANRLNISYKRIWIICWTISVLTGIGAAATLMRAFLNHLFLVY